MAVGQQQDDDTEQDQADGPPVPSDHGEDTTATELAPTLADDTVLSPDVTARDQHVSTPVACDEDELADLPTISPDHYELRGQYARGGIGEIIEAYDRRLDRVVAIKQLRRNTRYARLRFAREVYITAKLQHPNIIPVHEAGRWPEGQPFLAMKLVDGGSLEEALAACVSTQDRLRLVRNVADVADAMAYAHNQGIVHRDLKPSNVLLGPFGETVVIDWGLAKDRSAVDAAELPVPDSESRTHRYRTTDGVVMGTPQYMPPEQAAGPDVDQRADVYAIGALLYQLLSGRPPYFDVAPRRVLTRLAAGPPAPIEELAPEMPRDLVAIARKAMARRRRDRYASAEDMARELQRFLDGNLVGAHQYTLAELLWRFVRRQRAAVATAAFGLVLLGVLAVYSFVRIAGERDRAELSAQAEARARRAAEHRLAQAIVARARTALGQDPTQAAALLKTLGAVIAGAPSVAADAQQRGVAYRVLYGHQGPIETARFSPDGRFLACAGRDREVWLWDRQAGQGRKLSGHTDRVAALTFAPHGGTLATGSYDHQVRLWELPAGNSRALSGHRGAVKAIAFAPDGQRIVSVGDDGVRVWTREGESRHWPIEVDRARFALTDAAGQRLVTGSHQHGVVLWDLATGDRQRFEGHEGEVKAAALLTDPDRVVTAAEDGTVRVWPLDGSTELVLRGHRGGVESLAAWPQGGRFVTGGLDGTVRLWDAQDGSSQVIVRHQERVASVALSPDGRLVASGGWDKAVALFDRHTRSLRRLRGHRDVVSAVDFSADGNWLASASWDRQVRLWRVGPDARRVLSAHRIGVKTVDFSPDGTKIASGGHDDRVVVWDAATGEVLQVHSGHEDHVFRVRFSPDGSWLASSSDDRTVRLWSVDDDDSHVLEGHQADVEELAFSADSRWLASAGEDHAVGLWRVVAARGELLRGHSGPITAVQFSPDSARLASASRDGTVRLWDSETGKPRRTLRPDAGPVTALTMSHAGKLLATATASGEVDLWQLPRGDSRRLRASPGGVEAQVGIVALRFSPDDRWLAVAGHRVDVLLCPVTGEDCRALAGHSADVHALAFTADGGALVTASSDSSLRVWSVATGESRPLRGHAGPVFDLALAPGDGRIASASADATVRMWPLEVPPRAEQLPEWLADLTTVEER